MVTAERQIENLLYRYAELIDSGDFAGVGALFTHGAIVLDATRRDHDVAGAEAVQRLYEATTRRHDDGTPRTQHVNSNVIIDVDDVAGTATARSRFTVFQALEGLALQPIVAGRYHDRFVRRATEWWFSERAMEITLVGDTSRHLLVEL